MATIKSLIADAGFLTLWMSAVVCMIAAYAYNHENLLIQVCFCVMFAGFLVFATYNALKHKGDWRTTLKRCDRSPIFHCSNWLMLLSLPLAFFLPAAWREVLSFCFLGLAALLMAAACTYGRKA